MRDVRNGLLQIVFDTDPETYYKIKQTIGHSLFNHKSFQVLMYDETGQSLKFNDTPPEPRQLPPCMRQHWEDHDLAEPPDQRWMKNDFRIRFAMVLRHAGFSQLAFERMLAPLLGPEKTARDVRNRANLASTWNRHKLHMKTCWGIIRDTKEGKNILRCPFASNKSPLATCGSQLAKEVPDIEDIGKVDYNTPAKWLLASTGKPQNRKRTRE